MADAAMTGQGDVAGRLVETAARASHPHLFFGPDESAGPASRRARRDARIQSRDALAAVLPLLADEIDADAQTDADIAGDVARAGGDSRYASGRASGMHHAAYLLRGFAAEVAR